MIVPSAKETQNKINMESEWGIGIQELGPVATVDIQSDSDDSGSEDSSPPVLEENPDIEVTDSSESRDKITENPEPQHLLDLDPDGICGVRDPVSGHKLYATPVYSDTHPDQEEEIELLHIAKETPHQLYGLIQSDPPYYLDLIQSQGLGQELNCLVVRDHGNLRIKFRLYPEDRWTEVGYFAEDGDDQEVYQEFVDHVRLQMDKPRTRQKAKGERLSIEEILAQGGDRSHLGAEIEEPMSLKANLEEDEDLRLAREAKDHRMKLMNLSVTSGKTQSSKSTATSNRLNPRSAESSILPSHEQRPSHEQSPSQELLFRGYLESMLRRIAERIPEWLGLTQIHLGHPEAGSQTRLVQELEGLAKDCPKHLLRSYRRLINSVKSQDATDHSMQPNPFLQKLQQITEIAGEGECMEYINGFIRGVHKDSVATRIGSGAIYQPLWEPDFSHTRICDKLELSETDRILLKEYHIDLRLRWNAYCAELF